MFSIVLFILKGTTTIYLRLVRQKVLHQVKFDLFHTLGVWESV
jgi:hypothetical protein